MKPIVIRYKNDSQDPQRIDKFLSKTLGISRKEALRLLEQGSIKQGPKLLSEKDKGKWLEPSQSLEIQSLQALSPHIQAEPQNKLSILYQDANYLIVDKPATMPVMPLRPDETGTVLNHIICSYPQIQDVGEGGLKSGVVHRLDNDTSGCLMLALNQMAWQKARDAFKQHHSQKIYRCIVAGQVPNEGSYEAELEIGQHKPAKVKVLTKASKQSRLCTLSWKTLERFDQASLLEIKLETGFLHQIRVMFADLGYPVLGDNIYADSLTARLAPRQMLHAYQLSLLGITVHCPEAKDFQALRMKLAQTTQTFK